MKIARAHLGVVPATLLALAVASLSLAATSAGCSDDDRPAGQAGSISGDAAFSEASTSPDALAVITERPDLCQGLAFGGDPIAELELQGEPPPPLGGTLAAGTYDLVQVDSYLGEAPDVDAGDDDPPTTRFTGAALRGTLVVTANELRFVEAQGTFADSVATMGPESTRASLYRVEGTSIVQTRVCPTAAGPAPLPFSAVGGGLALYRSSARRELWVIRP